jgi:hypothetical protein
MNVSGLVTQETKEGKVWVEVKCQDQVGEAADLKNEERNLFRRNTQ